MAEAFAIVGLVSAIVAFIETGTRVIQRLNEAKDSGSGFVEVADQLPLLLNVVKELQGDRSEPSMEPSVGRALSRTVEGCLRQANILNAMLEKTTYGSHGSKLQRIRKTLGGVRNEGKVREVLRILETEDMYQSIVASNTSLPTWTGCLITDGRSDKYKFQDIKADLLANSLIRSISFESDKLSFSLHPLVREWIRLRLNDKDQAQYTIKAIMALTTMIEHSSKSGFHTPLK